MRVRSGASDTGDTLPFTSHAPAWIACAPYSQKSFCLVTSALGLCTALWEARQHCEGGCEGGESSQTPGAIYLHLHLHLHQYLPLHLHHLPASGKSVASSAPLVQRLGKMKQRKAVENNLERTHVLLY